MYNPVDIILLAFSTIIFLYIFYQFVKIHILGSGICAGLIILIWYYVTGTIFVAEGDYLYILFYSAFVFGVIGTLLMQSYAALFMETVAEPKKKPKRHYRRVH